MDEILTHLPTGWDDRLFLLAELLLGHLLTLKIELLLVALLLFEPGTVLLQPLVVVVRRSFCLQILQLNVALAGLLDCCVRRSIVRANQGLRSGLSLLST